MPFATMGLPLFEAHKSCVFVGARNTAMEVLQIEIDSLRDFLGNRIIHCPSSLGVRCRYIKRPKHTKPHQMLANPKGGKPAASQRDHGKQTMIRPSRISKGIRLVYLPGCIRLRKRAVHKLDTEQVQSVTCHKMIFSSAVVPPAAIRVDDAYQPRPIGIRDISFRPSRSARRS